MVGKAKVKSPKREVIDANGEILLAPGDGSVEIQVSKAILCTHSPVLKAMLEGAFKEGHEALNATATKPFRIPLPEIDQETLIILCKIFYNRADNQMALEQDTILHAGTIDTCLASISVCRRLFDTIEFLQSHESAASFINHWFLVMHEVATAIMQWFSAMEKAEIGQEAPITLLAIRLGAAQLALLFGNRLMFNKITKDLLTETVKYDEIREESRMGEDAGLDEKQTSDFQQFVVLIEHMTLKLRHWLRATAEEYLRTLLTTPISNAVSGTHSSSSLPVKMVQQCFNHSSLPETLKSHAKLCTYQHCLRIAIFAPTENFFRSIKEELLQLNQSPIVVRLEDLKTRLKEFEQNVHGLCLQCARKHLNDGTPKKLDCDGTVCGKNKAGESA